MLRGVPESREIDNASILPPYEWIIKRYTVIFKVNNLDFDSYIRMLNRVRKRF